MTSVYRVSITARGFALFSLTTPGCIAVDDDDLVLDGVLEIFGALGSVSTLRTVRGGGGEDLGDILDPTYFLIS